MSATFELELTAEALERAARGLRRYRALINRILGATPEEVRATMLAMEGFTPAQIREALDAYRDLHSSELAIKAVPPMEAEG